MQIQFNTSTMHLDVMPLDIGYASEKVTLKDLQGSEHTVGGQNGKTQLFITLPFIDENFVQELKEIISDLPKGAQGEYEVTSALIVANDSHLRPEIEGLDFYIDENQEFADYYGVGLRGEPCEGELTKALIVVSKDGAIFYDEFSKNICDTFNTATLGRKIMAAQECYTGKGCH